MYKFSKAFVVVCFSLSCKIFDLALSQVIKKYYEYMTQFSSNINFLFLIIESFAG